MVVSRSIYINAPIERVFALLCDPARRAGLNPNVKPIRVELEDGRPLHAGSVCRFRLETGGRIVDYRTRVTELVPLQRLVHVSDTAVPFAITLETAREGGGTRLMHSERFDPGDAMLREAAGAGARGWQRLFDGLLPFLDPDAARAEQAQCEARLERKLGENLERWLDAIRRELEAAG